MENKIPRPDSMDYLPGIKLILDAPADERQAQFRLVIRIAQSFIPSVLYKFSPLDSDDINDPKRVRALKDKKIYLSHSSSFNDPFDCRAFYYDPKVLATHRILKHRKGQMFDDFGSFVRLTCLTSCDSSSLPMWAHYANNHRGYCIAYDTSIPENHNLRALTFPVQYTNSRVDITATLDLLASQIEKNLPGNMERGLMSGRPYDQTIVYLVMLLLNLKNSTWSYEHEFRCSVPSSHPEIPFISAHPKEIYIGMNCPQIYETQLNEIGREQGIPVYKMQFDDLCGDYNLHKEKLI